MAKKPVIHRWERIEYLGKPCITGFIDGVKITRQVWWCSAGYVGTDGRDAEGKYMFKLGVPLPNTPRWLAHRHYWDKEY